MKFPFFTFLVILTIGLAGISCKGGDGPANENDKSNNPGSGSEFESEAREYESPDRVIWQKPDLVIQQLGDVTGKTVADLGAGTGYFSRRIAYKGARVIAIDIDPKAIQWMQEQKSRFPVELQDRLVIRKAKPDDPNLKENEVDIVLLVNTYSYIKNRVTYFEKLQKSIRQGGTVLVIDFKKTETPFGPKLQERVDIKDVEQELYRAGYYVTLKDTTSLEYQYILKAIRP
ncbi:MAG TPA: methyltransferase domain-containing protein [Saprospiraceae bacterium]|nr:methyltransferase domain-containing protein [Saprospiraceae bacterium]